MNTIKLKCKECGGIMDRDENRPILYCPYCGSKELVEESDEVTKARIEASTRLKQNEQELSYKEKSDKKDAIESIVFFLCATIIIILALIFGQ